MCVVGIHITDTQLKMGVQLIVAELWVARWFVFKPKIPVWVNFGGCCDGRWNILLPFGLFYGHLAYFTTFWYILR
jgi:hypothetical protein